MSECKHILGLGQGFNIQYMMEYVYCINCEKKWSKDEVTKCLNATECLSAENATNLYRMGDFESYPILTEKLFLYAEALEGKDD